MLRLPTGRREGRPVIAIDSIYDAAFDRGLFPALIERLCSEFGAFAGYLAWTDLDRGGGFHAQYGNDPVWLQRYVERYAAVDVMRPHLQAYGEGQCETAWALLQTAAIRESVFYREFLSPQGIVDNLVVNLVKRPDVGVFAHVALLRRAPAGPFSETDRAALRVLVPHLRRAVLIQSRLLSEGHRAAASRVPVGEGSSNALLLLDADGLVVDVDVQLRDFAGLHIGERMEEGPLKSAIARSIATGSPEAIDLTRGDDQRRVLLETRLLPRHPLADLSAGTADIRAVHIVWLDRPVTIAFDAFAALYRLTPTERRVMQDAVENGDLLGIGRRLGMATATARSHLHRIYEKTGSESFAQLASLAHRYRRLLNG